VEDWTGAAHGGEQFFFYRYRCRLFRHGMAVGEGYGSCNSFEARYRWRWVREDEVPPHLDKETLVARRGMLTEFAFAVDKAETSGQYGKPLEHWERFRAAIANGTARLIQKQTRSGKQMDAWEIDATAYRAPNEDIASQVNTIDKIAQKRALIAAVLIAANASEFFTQDLEDLSGVDITLVDGDERAIPTVAAAPDPGRWERTDWSELFYEEAAQIAAGYYAQRQRVNSVLREHGYTHLKRDQAEEMLGALKRHVRGRQGQAQADESGPIPF
jgi:hypothetical protein